ncbi:MAG: HD domain-containing protein [Caldilineaceae bacterium]|nr:HD domain-containing protein [Caldilineaceae bacterium]
MDGNMQNERLSQQIAFLLELDKLKRVLRRTKPVGSERYEDSAEHSWHLAMMALLLAEYADETVNVSRVIQMVLIHDIVEIDAGDTFLYDTAARQQKQLEEAAAAQRIFGLLPPDQAATLVDLWQEFEARESVDARFAYALDRLMPLLQNYHNAGYTWQENGIHKAQVWEANQRISDSSIQLWHFAQHLISDAVERGYLRP